MKTIIYAAAAALAAASAAPAADIANGEDVFAKQCRTCHMIVNPDGETVVRGGQTGPNQWGLVGRQAGSVEDFKRYGDSLKAAGEQGLVWTEEEIVEYLKDPRAYLRAYLDDGKARSLMAYKIRKEQDAVDVAAYLATMQ